VRNSDKPLSISPKAAAELFLAAAVALLLTFNARGQTPTIFQDDNDVDVTSFKGYYVSAFQVHTDDNPNDHHGSSSARIGDHLRIGVIGLGTWLEKLRTDGVVISHGEKHGDQLIDEQLPNIRLFIGGHLLTTLRPSHYFRDDPKWYKGNDRLDQDEAKQAEQGQRIWLDFSLVRDSNDKKSREDWSWLLKTPGTAPQMPVAIGIYNPVSNSGHVLPSYVDKGTQPQEFRLVRIAWDGWTISGILILGAALCLFLFLACRTGIIRDPNQPIREDGLPPYSLGRCQMAWWFFLAAGAFCFLWIVTGRGDTDTINSTVLGLIGISAGTALGALLISNNQVNPAIAAASPQRQFPNEISAALQALAEAKTARGNLCQHAPIGDAALAAADYAVQAKATALEDLKREFKAWKHEHRNQFLMDILSDDAAVGTRRIITFHRFQIVVWTLVLGMVFVSNVLSELVMPTFDSSVLVLMGISSGTYLGFKLPTGNKP
jgi:hypothetical protein